jgi:hypothetical protein
MKLFVLSLEEDASDWYEDCANNKFETLQDLLDGGIKEITVTC